MHWKYIGISSLDNREVSAEIVFGSFSPLGVLTYPFLDDLAAMLANRRSGRARVFMAGKVLFPVDSFCLHKMYGLI